MVCKVKRVFSVNAFQQIQCPNLMCMYPTLFANVSCKWQIKCVWVRLGSEIRPPAKGLNGMAGTGTLPNSFRLEMSTVRW